MIRALISLRMSGATSTRLSRTSSTKLAYGTTTSRPSTTASTSTSSLRTSQPSLVACPVSSLSHQHIPQPMPIKAMPKRRLGRQRETGFEKSEGSAERKEQHDSQPALALLRLAIHRRRLLIMFRPPAVCHKPRSHHVRPVGPRAPLVRPVGPRLSHVRPVGPRNLRLCLVGMLI